MLKYHKNQNTIFKFDLTGMLSYSCKLTHKIKDTGQIIWAKLIFSKIGSKVYNSWKYSMTSFQPKKC